MKLLLDTHIMLWAMLEPERLNRRVNAELRNPENEIWLSPISVWETMILPEKKGDRYNIMQFGYFGEEL